MELILKQPKDKPPFIGVLFENQFEASRLNQNWVNSYKTYFYSLSLEPNGSSIDLTLTLENFGLKYKYENLKYDLEKLKRFLFETKEAQQFNFSHIVQVLDQHVVVKTTVNQALFVLKCKEVKLIMED